MIKKINSTEKLINKLRFNILKPIFDDLSNIGYVLIKGESTSIYAYGEINKKFYNDIDILIERKNLKKVENLLESHGFEKVVNNREKEVFFQLFSHQTVPYQLFYKGIKVIIDINYDIFWGEKIDKKSSIITKEFIDSSIISNIYGINVNILPCKKAFINLCLHSYKDINSIYLIYSRRKINQEQLNEIYCFLKNYLIELELLELKSLADTYEVSPFLYVIFSYLYALTKDPFLKNYINYFKDELGERLVDSYGLSFPKTWNISIEQRIKSNDLYQIIEADLTEHDLINIRTNVQAFDNNVVDLI